MMDEAPPSSQPSRIRVGIAMPAEDGAAHALVPHLDAFCAALSAAVGAAVTGQRLDHYRDLLEAVHAGHIDLAWLPPIISVRASSMGRTIPIALPLRDGAAWFSSILFTRKGSPLRAPADLAGARAAWVDRQSAAGYQVIRASLRADGIDLDRAFGDERFLGSHEAMVEAVLSGEADVGATWGHLGPAGQIKSAGWGSAEVHVLALAGPIPADVIAAGIRLPVAQIRAVQRALCASPSPALKEAAARVFNAQGFVQAKPEHMAAITKLLEYMDDPRGDGEGPRRELPSRW
jgi:phosphonate transport system substrate-binding protein